MSKLFKEKATNWWVSDDQTLIESVYMLNALSSRYGRDERYWKHHKNHVSLINELKISEKLVLPFIQSVNGLRTVVLVEFDLERTESIAPIMIEGFKNNDIVAFLEHEKESE